jgi:hypothetical protein
MLNQTTFVVESAGSKKFILVDEKNSTAVSCKVANTGISADSDGRKIVKAGTPLAGDLTARGTAFVKATTTPGEGGASGSSNAVGILLHDVDVTDGTKNAQVVIFGTFDLNKFDSDVAALIDAETKAALKMIQFIK